MEPAVIQFEPYDLSDLESHNQIVNVIKAKETSSREYY